MLSPLYCFPRYYLWALRWLHGKNYHRRYRTMAGLVRRGETVLEPGCGPAALAGYLPASPAGGPHKINYRGFDANPRFIAYALKKNRRVKIGNILDPENYRPAPVVVVCDVLHHLPAAQKREFIKLCFQNARRLLIICEPQLKKPVSGSFFWTASKKIHEWFERDGINKVKLEYTFTPTQARRQIQAGFGVIPNRIKRKTEIIGADFMVVFSKHD